jgi:hypothetical protein
MAYKAGQCFDVPGPATEPQVTDGFVSSVQKRDCSGPHEGEVVSRWAPGRSYRDDPNDDDVLKKRALAECERRMTLYAPDPWRWPRSGRMNLVAQAQGTRMFGINSHVVCFVSTHEAGGTVGAIRQDPSALTPAQSAYLKIVDLYRVAASQKPSAKNAVQDIYEWQNYATAMAEANLQERTALRAHSWPAAAAQPLATLEALDENDAAHWRIAARAPGPEQVDREAAAAQVDDGYQQASIALRRILGLPTDDPRDHSVSV